MKPIEKYLGMKCDFTEPERKVRRMGQLLQQGGIVLGKIGGGKVHASCGQWQAHAVGQRWRVVVINPMQIERTQQRMRSQSINEIKDAFSGGGGIFGAQFSFKKPGIEQDGVTTHKHLKKAVASARGAEALLDCSAPGDLFFMSGQHSTKLTALQNLDYAFPTAPHWAGGFCSPLRKGTEALCRKTHGFFYARTPVMVGVAGSRKACRFLFPVCKPVTSAARCFAALVGGFNPLKRSYP